MSALLFPCCCANPSAQT
ncbi:hypothetical protein Zm00014a_014991 [Zea mays]|uniref:Uncharacterized protein n=1 Tax=Zea mays TaxID=4577 RepID=A0A3L6G229_MAIZE|nr:hypothetical protein Zm00014a_014991 [Zea mays]